MIRWILLLSILVGAQAVASETPCATYRVPVSDSSLAPYSSFALGNFQEVHQDGVFVLTYLLPLELTGVPITVSFTTSQSNLPNDPTKSLHFGGDHGSMDCMNDQCQVSFSHLMIDATQVTAFLKSVSQNDAELQARLRVSQTLLSDPGGVLSYQDCELK